MSGNALTYTIVVSNGGTASAAAVSLTDVLPAALTGAKFCTGPAGVVDRRGLTSPQSLGAIVAGGSVTVTDPGTVTGCSNLSNTATVSTTTTESNTANNSSGAIPTTVACPTIDVEKLVSVDGGTTFVDADSPTGPTLLDASTTPSSSSLSRTPATWP